MSAAGQVQTSDERLITFEVGSGAYALPIACVFEVGEIQPLACIPTLASEIAGVVNHHGDALPVLRRQVLLDLEGDEIVEPGHVLVIGARPTGGARLGLPVDRILGIVDGAGAAARGPSPVAERRPIEGRVVSVLDPERLVARAREVIGTSLDRSE